MKVREKHHILMRGVLSADKTPHTVMYSVLSAGKTLHTNKEEVYQYKVTACGVLSTI